MGWWQRRQEVDERTRWRVYRLALAMVASSDGAEDITQEVLCRYLQAKVRMADPWPWLRKVTVRAAMQMVREPGAVALPEEMLAHEPAPEQVIAIAQVLQQLSSDHRTVLALTYFEGLSYREIASELEIPEGSVASRLHAAKEQFRRRWEEP